MPEWFTPPEIARERGIRVSKVLLWIATGELEAVNFASRPGRRPRWRVRAESLTVFERNRSNKALISPRRSSRPRGSGSQVTTFF